MTYVRDPEFAPTAEQRANLTKLADYLAALPDDYVGFEMGLYHEDTVYADRAASPDCGTCACAVGHGPTAGIDPEKDEWWDAYHRRVFGAGSIHVDGAQRYMFGTHNPNDPHAAAARIREVLAAHSEPAA